MISIAIKYIEIFTPTYFFHDAMSAASVAIAAKIPNFIENSENPNAISYRVAPKFTYVVFFLPT